MMYRTIGVTAPDEPGQELAFGLRNHSVRCDGDLLTSAIEDACNTLAKESFEVISIVPIISGKSAGGSGYSYTTGAISTGKKIPKPE